MQGIRFELADLHAKIEACRWLTYRAAMLHETTTRIPDRGCRL